MLTNDQTLALTLKLFRTLKSYARKEYFESETKKAGGSELTFEQAVDLLVTSKALVRNKAGAVSLPRSEVMERNAEYHRLKALSEARAAKAFSEGTKD